MLTLVVWSLVAVVVVVAVVVDDDTALLTLLTLVTYHMKTVYTAFAEIVLGVFFLTFSGKAPPYEGPERD